MFKRIMFGGNYVMIFFLFQCTVGNLPHLKKNCPEKAQKNLEDMKILPESCEVTHNSTLPLKMVNIRNRLRSSNVEQGTTVLVDDALRSGHVRTRREAAESPAAMGKFNGGNVFSQFYKAEAQDRNRLSSHTTSPFYDDYEDIFMKISSTEGKSKRKDHRGNKPSGRNSSMGGHFASALGTDLGDRTRGGTHGSKGDEESEKPYFGAFVEVATQAGDAVPSGLKSDIASFRNGSSVQPRIGGNASQVPAKFQLQKPEINENLSPPLSLNSPDKSWKNVDGEKESESKIKNVHPKKDGVELKPEQNYVNETAESDRKFKEDDNRSVVKFTDVDEAIHQKDEATVKSVRPNNANHSDVVRVASSGKHRGTNRTQVSGKGTPKEMYSIFVEGDVGLEKKCTDPLGEKREDDSSVEPKLKKREINGNVTNSFLAKVSNGDTNKKIVFFSLGRNFAGVNDSVTPVNFSSVPNNTFFKGGASTNLTVSPAVGVQSNVITLRSSQSVHSESYPKNLGDQQKSKPQFSGVGDLSASVDEGRENVEGPNMRYPVFDVEPDRFPFGSRETSRVIGRPLSKEELKPSLYDTPSDEKAPEHISKKLGPMINKVMSKAKLTPENMRKRLGICKQTREPSNEAPPKEESEYAMKNVMNCLSSYMQDHSCPCITLRKDAQNFLSWMLNGKSRTGCCLPGPAQQKSKYSFLFNDNPHAIRKGPCQSESPALKAITVFPLNCSARPPLDKHPAQIVSSVDFRRSSFVGGPNPSSVNLDHPVSKVSAIPEALERTVGGVKLRMPLQNGEEQHLADNATPHIHARDAKREKTSFDSNERDNEYDTYEKGHIYKLLLFSGDDLEGSETKKRPEKGN